MLSLQARLEAWASRAEDFLSCDKDEVYNRCIHAALDDPKTKRLLGKRDGVTQETVLDFMTSSSYVRFTTAQCPARTLTALDAAAEKLDEVLEKHERAARETEWN